VCGVLLRCLKYSTPAHVKMPTPGEDGVPASRRPTLFDMLFTHGMQTTFDIILNLFFSRMEILGLDNFPKYGPTIIVGNHNNQFADGILLSSKVYELGREVCWKSGT
jgi:1-acyl-sn-glycerol-3-phosphate acyltransferase